MTDETHGARVDRQPLSEHGDLPQHATSPSERELRLVDALFAFLDLLKARGIPFAAWPDEVKWKFAEAIIDHSPPTEAEIQWACAMSKQTRDDERANTAMGARGAREADSEGAQAYTSGTSNPEPFWVPDATKDGGYFCSSCERSQGDVEANGHDEECGHFPIRTLTLARPPAISETDGGISEGRSQEGFEAGRGMIVKSANCSIGEHARCPRDFRKSGEGYFDGYWRCQCKCHAASLVPKTLSINDATTAEQMEAFTTRRCGRCQQPANKHLHVSGTYAYLCPTIAMFVEPQASSERP